MIDHKHHVLIVEDNENYIETVEERLDSILHSHESVLTLLDAYEKLKSTNYCYVILDLEIPVKSGRQPLADYGIQVTKFIHEELPGVKPGILVLTHHTTHDLTVEFLTSGIVDYVVEKQNMDERLLKGIEFVVKKRCNESGCASFLNERRPSIEETIVDITSGEFLLKPDRVDIKLSNGEIIENVIKKKYPNSTKEYSRPFLFISAIADDNTNDNRIRRRPRTIRDRMENIEGNQDSNFTEDNVYEYANYFRGFVKKEVEKLDFKIDIGLVLPKANKSGYLLGDGFFITKNDANEIEEG